MDMKPPVQAIGRAEELARGAGLSLCGRIGPITRWKQPPVRGDSHRYRFSFLAIAKIVKY